MKLLTGDKLKKRAIELGVSLAELGTESGLVSEPILQRRVMEAERFNRESKLWIIALASAIASIFSAIAAWVAVCVKSGL